jgi:hypothetical protein
VSQQASFITDGKLPSKARGAIRSNTGPLSADYSQAAEILKGKE